jgi:PAT family beta-lactamase induction signal transducer AmpG
MINDLADSSRLRYATGATMYFAQGVPSGLLHVAIPAWLASQGVAAGQIASYIAVIILPWAFKLLTGPLMDRYEFLPMGRRRPWVLGAQLGLTLAFLGLVLVEDPVEQIGLLMLMGVLINVFAATQDVAVDGMSIDLTPVEEQGRLNGFMTFGKAIGWSVSSAVSGIMLVTFGLGATAILAATVMGVVFLSFTQVLERDGERRLPWSTGAAATEHQPGKSFAAVFRGLNAVLWNRVSLIVMGVMLFDGLVHGYGHALMPIAAINLFGFTTPQWAQLVALMGLIGAAVALGLGPLIDRFGAKRMLFATALLVGLHAFLLAETQILWQNNLYVRTMLATWVMLGPVTMVCVIALGMSICGSVNSATQFAIYMSIANFGSSIGAKIYGLVSEQTSYPQSYVLLGALALGLLLVLFFHRPLGRISAGHPRTAPRYTMGMTLSESGTFWSGAIRCPKCHADMEHVVEAGTEIDRCLSCFGLWFDPGEVERLRSRKAAIAIDIGDPAIGKQHNVIDRYRCPRCAGPMIRMVDPLQTHVWFEKCGSCHGSFFDAGEFQDLATLSVSDVFKRLTTPQRS